MDVFRPVNTTLTLEPRSSDEGSLSTPRPDVARNSQPQQMHRDDATTPTRANFGALANQRPLPAEDAFPPPTPLAVAHAEDMPHTQLNRGNSHFSSRSQDSQDDVDMDKDGTPGQDGEDDEGDDSGDEIINADGTRTKKKGKSQRFYCTDYPPCSLSFTRSEHLARHIRKHTGERPFQCHCSRRFSRLDNLRQHAQTVHQNEEIPQDSLAATGTRFQRQIRTDRIRTPGSRSRGNTVGNQTGPVRGHQRNSLSTSSISSMGSAYSHTSDMRKRPAPLVVAGERSRYSQEIFERPDSPSGPYPYGAQSPGFSTPTSATFSTGQNSPRWTNESPLASHSRTASLYSGHRTPGRRLSVPSAGSPFRSPHGNSYPSPIGHMAQMAQMQHPNMGSFSTSSSIMASPTTPSSGSPWSRRESLSATNEEAWRRRTWHPDSYTNAQQSAFTSRLSQVTTPNTYAVGRPPQPPVVPSNAPPLEPIRLPGIASFDPIRNASTLVHREPSPMLIDTPPSRVPIAQPSYPVERPNSQHWDQGIQRNFNQLNIAHGPPATEWATEANQALQAQAQASQPNVRFEDPPISVRPHTSGGPGAYHYQHQSAPPTTPREAKRLGWYQGPVARTSPVDSSGSEGGAVPGTPVGSSDFHPSIVHASGWVESRGNEYAPPLRAEGIYTYGSQQPTPTQQHQMSVVSKNNAREPDSNTLRLDALVAVATSEENVTAAY